MRNNTPALNLEEMKAECNKNGTSLILSLNSWLERARTANAGCAKPVK